MNKDLKYCEKTEKFYNIFTKIKDKYDRTVYNLMKKFEKLNIKLIKHMCHLNFNSKCLQTKVLPQSCRVKPLVNNSQGVRAAINFGFTSLQARVQENRDTCRLIEEKISKIQTLLLNQLSKEDFNELKIAIKTICFKNTLSISKKHNKKFEKFKYLENNSFKSKYVKTNYNSDNISDQNEWVVNLSSLKLNQLEYDLLSLDPKFIPSAYKLPIANFIASIESSIAKFKLDDISVNDIRNKCVNILSEKELINFSFNKTQKDTLRRLYSNKNITITKADKGSVTVLMNTSDYNNKIHKILHDTNFYKQIFKDKTNKLTKTILENLSIYKNKNYIDLKLFNQLKPR